jgi:hypothetical protein
MMPAAAVVVVRVAIPIKVNTSQAAIMPQPLVVEVGYERVVQILHLMVLLQLVVGEVDILVVVASKLASAVVQVEVLSDTVVVPRVVLVRLGKDMLVEMLMLVQLWVRVEVVRLKMVIALRERTLEMVVMVMPLRYPAL